MNVMTLYDKSISDATAVSVMTRVKARVMARVRVRVRVMIIRGISNSAGKYNLPIYHLAPPRNPVVARRGKVRRAHAIILINSLL